MMRSAAGHCRTSRRSAAGFTLTELLTVIAVILIIAGVTAISVRNISRDARLSTAKNAVAAALDTARGVAIRDRRYTAVVFRARKDGASSQFIEIVTAQTVGHVGDLYANVDLGGYQDAVERLVPVAGLAPRRLPRGINIAAPKYAGEIDDEWMTCSYLPGIEQFGEAAGVVIAVMYAPDGTVRLRRDDASAARYFVDFNSDRAQRQGDDFLDNLNEYPDNTGYCNVGMGYSSNGALVPMTQYYCQHREDDEPYVSMAPFLAVFDEAAARDQHNPAVWTDPQTRLDELSIYITENADRIHFNRYTGVVLK